MAVRRARAQAPKGRLKRGIQYLTREYDLYLMLIPMILFYILFSEGSTSPKQGRSGEWTISIRCWRWTVEW